MIDNLQKEFQSMLKALDIFYVIKDLKPVSRIIINENELPLKIKFLESLGLKTCVSNFKIISGKETDKQFTNKGIRINKNLSEQGDYLVYVSKQLKLAELSKELELQNNHKELGKSLGYPLCCSKFFEQHYTNESKRFNDYTLASLNNSEGYQFPYKNNFCVRSFDIALISHFPCQFQCQESLTIAERNLGEIKKDNNEIAIILNGMLKGAVIYTENKGVFYLRGISIDKNRLYYRTVISSVNTILTRRIKEAPSIEILNRNKIKIKNKTIDGKYGFGVFN